MLLESENGSLNVKINGLEEEASDAAANLQDAITTNDALTKKLKELEHECQTCKCVYKSNVTVYTSIKSPLQYCELLTVWIHFKLCMQF